MEALDTSYGEVPLQPTWVALGHRVAAATGASTALIALLGDAPLQAASLRGAAAWFAVLVCVRAGAWLLSRTTPEEPAEEEVDGAAPAGLAETDG